MIARQGNLGWDVHQRHPQRDRLVGVQGPVDLILVPGGEAAAGFLEQRLVVEDAHALDAQEVGGNLAKTLGQHEAAHRGVFLPQVDDLQERLAIGIALVQRAGFGGVVQRSACNTHPDGHHR